MQQPDLKSRNVNVLEFSFSIPFSHELYSSVKKIMLSKKSSEVPFFDLYKDHRVLAIVKKENKGYKIEYTYFVGTQRKLPENLPRIKELAEAFYSSKDTFSYECSVHFLFEKKLHLRSIINLPMMNFISPNSPFDRIQGIHLVKLDGNVTKYDIYFEASFHGTLLETIEFKLESPFKESTPDDILRKAETISNNVVFKDEKNAQINR
jgi:hypothetical protein